MTQQRCARLESLAGTGTDRDLHSQTLRTAYVGLGMMEVWHEQHELTERVAFLLPTYGRW